MFRRDVLIRCSLWLILSLAAMYVWQAHYAMAQGIGGIDSPRAGSGLQPEPLSLLG